ncbi:HAMP domain-containing sensor histidine kinase [Pseudoxanthomonas sp.]|uniref:sensor histidine kinase n=1 Tax=Pseudoxanthomonas sp. TaxID=1871049 RepID=UPI00262D06B1|nr:HAMP domain-containing sensor histidine kinase [Pseudoxanthomonas sp.]WDS35471.1 MAG: HAMP domain-containing sensor histidine kinase [Pseudoxanthomonas sp.]
MTDAAGGRSGRSIFTRTFVLLAAALVLAQCIGLALLFMRTPVWNQPVDLPEVVALLSTRMPASNKEVSVTDEPQAPEGTGAMNVEDPFMRAILAEWMRQPTSQVHFFRAKSKHTASFDARMNDAGGMPPPRLRNGPPWVRQMPNGEPDGAASQDRTTPPPPRDDAPDFRPPGQMMPPDASDDQLGENRAFGFGPRTLVANGFIAGAQQADGSWRVVRYNGVTLSNAFKVQLAVLFLLGLLLMLPLAWWFSRALSAPIREFAAAADRLGRDPDASPLERRGPAEIIQATDSFNAMQARLSRMVAERTHMVGAIAHDLRTPLARLAFRLNDIDSPLRERAAADIDEMAHMITVALEFLRDQSRSGPRDRLDFQQLVESVVDDAADIGQDVTLEPGDSVMLDGDPLALRRVAGNLIGNAVKYGRCARVRVRQDNGHARLEIDDDGPGIDPALGDKLFMPFFRGENSRNKETGGIGLGLSAARAIVLAHGGEIGLSNREGGGLRAWVILPRAKNEQ